MRISDWSSDVCSSDLTEVLKSINLSVGSGEFVAILGFSGTGKTTLISLMSGLINADSGEIVVNGRPSAGSGSDRGLVFQSYSLMPWLSVAAKDRKSTRLNSSH